ncbi:MAG: RNA 2',3'-cyclic phosphodiesterase, partial [Comamonadaceae bacterium]
MPARLIEQALRAGQSHHFPPIKLAFDRVLSFGAGDKRPVVLDNAQPSQPLR